MNSNRSGKPHDGKIVCAADQEAVETERSTADADLKRPLEADGAALEAHGSSSVAREPGTSGRVSAHVAGAMDAGSRSETATARDAIAAMHDETARHRDVRSETFDRAIAASEATMADKLERVRARASAARVRASADRDEAARDRAVASADRDEAARYRAEACAERSRLQAELHSAHLDDLTGAFRRETGRVALRHEIDRALRADGRFVIAFVDIDGMKRVNDRDGHAAGDHVLQTLVWSMRSNLRSFDPVVRYGGDEFVCGVGGVDIDEVRRRFEVINRSVQNDVGVGISVGLAGLEPDDTLDRLTARADAALLAAKRHRGA